MIIVRVELHSAITGKITELARMMIHNVGRAPNRPKSWWRYGVRVFRGRSKDTLDRQTVQRTAVVSEHPSDVEHVWHLVAKALKEADYGNNQYPRHKRFGEVHPGAKSDGLLQDQEPGQN